MLQLFFFLMILTAKCVAFVKHKRERYQSEHHSVVQCCTAARGHKSCHFLSVHFLSLCRAFLTQFVVYFRCSTSQQQLQKFTFTLKWQDRAYFKDFRDFFFSYCGRLAIIMRGFVADLKLKVIGCGIQGFKQLRAVDCEGRCNN